MTPAIVIIAPEQVWREVRTGRRLRVGVYCDSCRIGVRNCATGRLTYIHRGRFATGEFVLEPKDPGAAHDAC